MEPVYGICATIHSDILVMVKNFANQLRKRLMICDKEVAKMSGYFNAR